MGLEGILSPGHRRAAVIVESARFQSVCHTTIDSFVLTGVRMTDSDSRERQSYQTFDRIYPDLRRFAAVVADVDVDPDDLVHDALIQVLERVSIAELRDPDAYLRRVMLNLSIDNRRRRAVFRRIRPKLFSSGAHLDHYPSDLALLDNLDPTTRAVVFLADVSGLSAVVIGEQLGMADGTVRKRLSRGRQELRRLVDLPLQISKEK